MNLPLFILVGVAGVLAVLIIGLGKNILKAFRKRDAHDKDVE